MKQRIVHIILICLIACPVLFLVSSCSSHNDDAPEAGDKVEEAVLVLQVETMGQTRAAGDGEPLANEKMHSLRVVVLSQATEKVEFNRHYSMESGGVGTYSILVPVKPDGKKTIYLVANEEDAGELKGSDKTLAGYLESVAVGSATSEFTQGIKDAVFTMPEKEGFNIPMSAVYEVETSPADAGTRKDCGTFYVVRTMTKYSFSFRNNRTLGYSVYVKSWVISGLGANQAYLMPHFSPTAGGCWGYKKNSEGSWEEMGDGWTEAGKKWKEWLAKVSDESNANPDNPTADENGWLTCYNVPSAKESTLSHIYGDNGLEIPMDGTDHDGEVTKYYPESKHLKEAGFAFTGEQEYYVNLVVTEGNSSEVHTFSSPVPLPNLRSLFRNTHVKIHVTFGGDVGEDCIYARIVDWSVGTYTSGGMIEEL